MQIAGMTTSFSRMVAKAIRSLCCPTGGDDTVDPSDCSSSGGSSGGERATGNPADRCGSSAADDNLTPGASDPVAAPLPTLHCPSSAAAPAARKLGPLLPLTGFERRPLRVSRPTHAHRARIATLASGCNAEPKSMVERTTLVLPSWSHTLPIHRSPPSSSSALRGPMQPIPRAIRMQTRFRSARPHTPSAARRKHHRQPLEPLAPGGACGGSEIGRESRLLEPRATSLCAYALAARSGTSCCAWAEPAFGLIVYTMPRPTEKKRRIHTSKYRPITCSTHSGGVTG